MRLLMRCSLKLKIMSVLISSYSCLYKHFRSLSFFDIVFVFKSLFSFFYLLLQCEDREESLSEICVKSYSHDIRFWKTFIQVIAKAVAERQAMRLKNGDKGQIVCIGVAPWGNIEKRDEIERAVCASEERVNAIYCSMIKRKSFFPRSDFPECVVEV